MAPKCGFVWEMWGIEEGQAAIQTGRLSSRTGRIPAEGG